MDACIIPTCHHILDNGSLCRCAATRGKAFCRHHLESALRRRNMARARRCRRLWWMSPLDAAQTFRDRSNCLQVALESGAIDLEIAGTMLRVLRMRDAVQRNIDRMGKPPGTPKSFRLYQVPASSLFLYGCLPSLTQVIENTASEEEAYTNHNSQSSRIGRQS